MAGGSVDAMPVKVCGICRQEVPWSDWTEHVAQHSRDRRNSSSPDWRQIRQAIYVRDGGRCTHVDQNGHRCQATQELAVHHIDGDRRNDDPENLRLVCPQHPAGLGPPAWFAPDVRCGGRPSSARSCPVVEQLEGRLHAVGAVA